MSRRLNSNVNGITREPVYKQSLQVHPHDRHPNAYANGLVAERLADELFP